MRQLPRCQFQLSSAGERRMQQQAFSMTPGRPKNSSMSLLGGSDIQLLIGCEYFPFLTTRCLWGDESMLWGSEQRAGKVRVGSQQRQHAPDRIWRWQAHCERLAASMPWRKVFWSQWGCLHVLYCTRCGTHFQARHLDQCWFHPDPIQFSPTGPGETCQHAVDKCNLHILFSGYFSLSFKRCPAVPCAYGQSTDASS